MNRLQINLAPTFIMYIFITIYIRYSFYLQIFGNYIINSYEYQLYFVLIILYIFCINIYINK